MASFRLRVFRIVLAISIGIELVVAQAEFSKEEMNIPEAKCELCKSAVKILFNEIEKTDPTKKIEVGSFRLKADGSSSQKTVLYKGSEFQLEDMLDDNLVCSKLQDMVPVTDKLTGSLKMLNMVEDMDKLHTVQFFTNADMNSKMNTLQIYRPGDPDPEEEREKQQRKERECQELFGDHEEELVELFRKKKDQINSPFKLARVFCHQQSNVCPNVEKLDELRSEEEKSTEEDELSYWEHESRDEL